MIKDKTKTGAGYILIVFTLMYITFAVAANIFAFSLDAAADAHGVAKATLQAAAIIMDIAASSFLALCVYWNIKAHKGWGEKVSIKIFGWLCLNSVLMFFLPPALSWDAANSFPRAMEFMGFVPVLAPVVIMIAAAVVMLDIIKQKNGGTLRTRR